MKSKTVKLIIFTVFSLSVALFAGKKVKAEVKNINITKIMVNSDKTVGGGVSDTISQGAINTTSPAITTTPPAITTPSGIQVEDEDEEEDTTGVEVFDGFSVGGISYTVTGIKGDKVYLGVSGVVNDKTTTVFVPKKIKYKDKEMFVTSIEEEGFSDLDCLRKVVIGADISYIDTEAFRGAKKFDRLVIKTDTLKKVGKNIFKNVSNKLIIEVPKKSLESYKKLFKNKGTKIKEIRAVKK